MQEIYNFEHNTIEVSKLDSKVKYLKLNITFLLKTLMNGATLIRALNFW